MDDSIYIYSLQSPLIFERVQKQTFQAATPKSSTTTAFFVVVFKILIRQPTQPKNL